MTHIGTTQLESRSVVSLASFVCVMLFDYQNERERKRKRERAICF